VRPQIAAGTTPPNPAIAPGFCVLVTGKEIHMEVRVIDESGELLWTRNDFGGYTSFTYAQDSTLMLIRAALESALNQCNGELAVADDIDRMADVCTPAS